MKNKILSIALVFVILLGATYILTGCESSEKSGSSKTEKKYSELITAVRENTTSKEHKIGEIVDYAIKDGKWEEEYYTSTERYVKVTGIDKESGEEVTIAWLVSLNKNGVEKIDYGYYTKGGNNGTMLGCAQYLLKYETELYEK